MRRVQRLLALQQLDLDLDASRKRVRAIDALLTESDRLNAARQAGERIRQRLVQLHTRAKDLELESASLDAKIANVEDRLYSGAVKNPKELSDLQMDAGSLRRHKAELDEVQLQLMDELEQADQEAASIHAERAQIETEWQREQEALRAERARLVEHITVVETQRATERANVASEDLSAYDQLRPRRNGQAVAHVAEGACSVCGVEVSEYNIGKLRHDLLIACSNCERLLIAD